jgi:hypothetical protein
VLEKRRIDWKLTMRWFNFCLEERKFYGGRRIQAPSRQAPSSLPNTGLIFCDLVRRRTSREPHFSKIYSTLSVESGLFCIHFIIDVKNIEQEVELVVCGILLQVFELRNSFVPERLPVKCATKLEQDIFNFCISVLTTGGAV